MVVLVEIKIKNGELCETKMIRTTLLPWHWAFGCIVAMPVAVGANDVSVCSTIGTLDDTIVVLIGIDFWAYKWGQIALHEAELRL